MTRLAVCVEGRTFAVELAEPPDTGLLYLWLDDQAVQIRIPQDRARAEAPGWLVINDRPYEIELDPELRWIDAGAGHHQLEIKDLEDITLRTLKGDGRVKAPIPGQITRLFVSPGEAVVVNQPLCVLEAMKMENEIRAPLAGVVSALPIAVGHIVNRGQLLAEINGV